MRAEPTRAQNGYRLPLLLAVALLLQLPLIFNPGYYSHDELQWASWSFGRAFEQVPWARLVDVDTFQYRPLTFNVWMLLSFAFFDAPYLMHAACALFAIANVLLLRAWLGQLGIPARAVFIACTGWLINPYAMQTHGWVGTIADLLWVMFALIAIVAVNRVAASKLATAPRCMAAFALALTLTALSLLSKEGALVLPAAFVFAAFAPRQRGTQVAAAAGSTLAVGLYLALRLQVILAGSAATTAYSIHDADPLARWIEYMIFPAILERAEPRALLLQSFGLREWGSIVLVSLLTLLIFMQRGWRLGVLWLAAPLAALVPVLPLGFSMSHYAYGASVAGAAVLAVAATGFNRFARALLAAWLLLTAFHGLQIADKTRDAGVMQHRLGSDVNALRVAQPERRLRIRAEHLKHQPNLRTLHEVPNYLGIPWGEFVTGVDQTDFTANYEMRRDGSLRRWPPPPPAPIPPRRLGPRD
jgi:hypothetical protein